MKFHIKHKFFAGVAVILILLGLWQIGKINLPPKMSYALRYAAYKVSQSASIKEPATIKMDVKPHRQEHSLSCEVAALKIALAAVGVEVSETELIQKLKFDPTPKKGKIWGDPHKGFVGDIDGQMPSTGYGVYDGPIAELALHWRKAELLDIKTPEALAAHLLAGRSLVVWGYYGRGQKLSWTTPEGKPIIAVNGEHARALIGFTGDVNGPTGFYLMDPKFGPIYWTTQQLISNWDALDRMAVIVYPEESKLTANP